MVGTDKSRRDHECRALGRFSAAWVWPLLCPYGLAPVICKSV